MRDRSRTRHVAGVGLPLLAGIAVITTLAVVVVGHLARTDDSRSLAADVGAASINTSAPSQGAGESSDKATGSNGSKKRPSDTPPTSKKATRVRCTQPALTPTPAPDHQVTVAQANIKTNLSGARFSADLAATVSGRPHLVSLNEVGHRSDAALTPAGYALHRGPAQAPISQTRSTAVLWRTDTWTKVGSGWTLMVPNGPQKWDAGRSASWTVLRHADGSMVSLVSLHHMVNPAKVGPDPARRQQLYGEGLAKVRELAETLQVLGPVFVAGDFNNPWSNTAAWAPRAVMGSAGMTSTQETLGDVVTHDGGGRIDLVLYNPDTAHALSQSTRDLHSDHRLVQVTFAVKAAAPKETARKARGACSQRG